MEKKDQCEAARRYDEALGKAGEDYTSISKQLDLSRQTTHSWSVGKKILTASASNILNLCNKLNIRPEWLIFGEGSMEPTIDNYDLDRKKLVSILKSIDVISTHNELVLTYEQKAAYIDILYYQDIEDDPEFNEKFLKRIEKLTKLKKLITT